MKILLLFLISLAGFSQQENLEQKYDKTIKDLADPLAFTQIKNSIFTDYISKEVKQNLIKHIKNNPFSSMSEGQLRAIIDSGANHNKIVSSFLSNNPKVYNFLIKWLRDKKAMPSFLMIINRDEDLKVYGIIVIAVLVIGFILNLINSKGGLFKRIFNKILIGVGCFSINVTCFVYIFYENIKPTWNLL
ncbi:MAG: hypothetical protein N4A33_01985 [Bacteriovoracaceae bacterium]|nr:hypothetical protein [Bacteriovoracaceae bacterium]